MIRATELSGRAVVDMDAAEKLGHIDKIIIDPEGRRVAGFEISRGGSFLGEKSSSTIPATSVHAIGPDAMTVRHPADVNSDGDRFDQLPRVSDVIGRKVLSRDGRLLGVVDDVLISGADGQIVGYQLAEVNGIGGLFGARKRARGPYLRADADLRAGRDLIVAPDDALSEWDDDRPQTASAVDPASGPPDEMAADDRTSDWFRRDHPQRVAPPGVLP
jgi:uncharacterized protein YrrD